MARPRAIQVFIARCSHSSTSALTIGRRDKTDFEHMFEHGQFEVFRKHLTVNAGFYEKLEGAKGEVRVEAKSLSYASMEHETSLNSEYNAMINAAIKHVKFAGKQDE